MRRDHQPPPCPGGRPYCTACLRPPTHCVCSLIKAFEAHTNVLVIQHPNERRKYYSTVKLLSAGVKNLSVIRGLHFGPREIEDAIGNRDAYLLFPSPEAKDASEIRLSKDSVVIAIDGTWSEARKILRRNEILRTLPHVSFRTPLASNYRIRKQPKDHYLSTLESVGHLLKQNASAFGLDQDAVRYGALFEAFDQMVLKQLSYFPRMRQAA